MKIIPFLLVALLTGCIPPKEVAPPPERSTCPPLPLLPAAATPIEQEVWSKTVIAMYVSCAKGHK